VSRLDGLSLSRLVEYVRDWNTHAKYTWVAQHVLSNIFRAHPPTVLQQSKVLVDSLQSMILYGERHFTRMEKLVQRAYHMEHM